MTWNSKSNAAQEDQRYGNSRPGVQALKRWMLRVSLALIASVTLLSMSGALYQEVSSRSDRSEFPPPGQMISLGSHQIHIQESGTNHDGPSVVLLAGAGSMSTQWAWIQQDVASFARVVSYDRAGLGWSEPNGQAQDAGTVADELYTLLRTADIPGPYILVGHSLGGAHARVFADLFPDEVAGMILLDPVSPEFWTQVDPEALNEPRAAARQAKLFPYLARFGVLRLLDPFGAATDGLPNQQREEATALFASTKHASASRDDYQEILDTSLTMELLRDVKPIGDLPVIVLTRTEPDDAYTGPQQAIDADLAASSIHGSHRLVAGADHITLVTKKEYARETTDAIREMLDVVNSQG